MYPLWELALDCELLFWHLCCWRKGWHLCCWRQRCQWNCRCGGWPGCRPCQWNCRCTSWPFSCWCCRFSCWKPDIDIEWAGRWLRDVDGSVDLVGVGVGVGPSIIVGVRDGYQTITFGDLVGVAGVNVNLFQTILKVSFPISKIVVWDDVVDNEDDLEKEVSTEVSTVEGEL